MAEEKTWQPLELIKVTTDYLAGKSVPNPRLDAEVLLCDILGLQRRVDLYAGFEREISGKELAAYRELVRRRSVREPVSRILGRREFMGVTFKVTPDVLSPRPETELLVEAALDVLQPKKAAPQPPTEEEVGLDPARESEPGEMMPEELERLLDSYAENVDDDSDLDSETPLPVRPAVRRHDPQPVRTAGPVKKPSPATGHGPEVRVLDLGTGSGCIVVAIAAMCPRVRAVGIDASPKALAVAKKNATEAKVAERVEFRQGDWFAGCRRNEQFDVIVSNPPYLVEGDKEIWPEVSRYDPPTALYGGQDGYDCYRRIIPGAPEWLAPEGWLFLEVGAGQAGRVADLLSRRGFREVGITRDYGGVERVVKAKAPL